MSRKGRSQAGLEDGGNGSQVWAEAAKMLRAASVLSQKPSLLPFQNRAISLGFTYLCPGFRVVGTGPAGYVLQVPELLPTTSLGVGQTANWGFILCIGASEYSGKAEAWEPRPKSELEPQQALGAFADIGIKLRVLLMLTTHSVAQNYAFCLVLICLHSVIQTQFLGLDKAAHICNPSSGGRGRWVGVQGHTQFEASLATGYPVSKHKIQQNVSSNTWDVA